MEKQLPDYGRPELEDCVSATKALTGELRTLEIVGRNSVEGSSDYHDLSWRFAAHVSKLSEVMHELAKILVDTENSVAYNVRKLNELLYNFRQYTSPEIASNVSAVVTYIQRENNGEVDTDGVVRIVKQFHILRRNTNIDDVLSANFDVRLEFSDQLIRLKQQLDVCHLRLTINS